MCSVFDNVGLNELLLCMSETLFDYIVCYLRIMVQFYAVKANFCVYTHRQKTVCIVI